MATLVVLDGGECADRALHLAREHASFDPDRRRVLRAGDVTLPYGIDVSAAAVALNACNEIVGYLDRDQALNEAWIEDAFVRAAVPVRIP